MSRPQGALRRIITGVLIPAPLGALCFAAFLTAGQILSDFNDTSLPQSLRASSFSILLNGCAYFLLTWALGVLPAFAMVGIQSVLYSFIMEFVLNRHLHSNVLVTISSTACGLAAASPFFNGNQSENLQVAGAGVLVGLVTGVILRRMYL